VSNNVAVFFLLFITFSLKISKLAQLVGMQELVLPIEVMKKMLVYVYVYVLRLLWTMRVLCAYLYDFTGNNK